MRTHEQLALFSKGKSKINKVWVNKIENDLLIAPHNITADLKRLIGKLKGFSSGDDFMMWRDGAKWFGEKKVKHAITASKTKKSCSARSCYDSHIIGKRLSSVLRVHKEHYKFKHPTQKPVELMKQLVQLVSKEGDLICDPFMGSGSTEKACKELTRNFVGIEIDDEYFDIAKEDIENY